MQSWADWQSAYSDPTNEKTAILQVDCGFARTQINSIRINYRPGSSRIRPPVGLSPVSFPVANTVM